MSLTTVDDVIEELDYTYDALGFADQAAYEVFVEKRLNWASYRIADMIGINYDAVNEDVVWAEIFWACSIVLARDEKDLDEGFQIGDFILYPPRIEKRPASKNYWDRAQGLLAKYLSPVDGGGKIVALEPEEDTDTTVYPVDQVWLRRI